MARSLGEAVEAARSLLEALEAEGFRVVEAYLFGSYARGDWVEHSDAGLVVVSPDFEGWLERLRLLARLEVRLGLPVGLDVLYAGGVCQGQGEERRGGGRLALLAEASVTAGPRGGPGP